MTPPTIRTPYAIRLQQLGFAVNESIPGYGMVDVLKRFQAASLDRNGNPLEVDGVFGQITFDALFRDYPLPGATITDRVLAIARSQIGICEVPPGSNRGPQIDLVLKSVGLSPGYAWCSAWVYWCFQQAARQLGIKNPCPKNAGVLNMWALAGYKESGIKRLTSLQVEDEPKLVKPGMQFLMKLSTTSGHTGLVESVGKGGLLTTIEGNTNQNTATREGVAVCRLTRRRIDSINLGFISYE